ncbi:hypothetical protein BJ508DRAFT_340550 [Ascobolus immersus RN42]|uniref:Uncharacterized protein n=1 Tax=Ascobolus immersus RN42 TaxID=1160509 RepID=A0A3N4HQ85_ASCIM|nr:hypothetical protein BJ508DRAFT_340550 [Ascobolus immersus RN42]
MVYFSTFNPLLPKVAFKALQFKQPPSVQAMADNTTETGPNESVSNSEVIPAEDSTTTIALTLNLNNSPSLQLVEQLRESAVPDSMIRTILASALVYIASSNDQEMESGAERPDAPEVAEEDKRSAKKRKVTAETSEEATEATAEETTEGTIITPTDAEPVDTIQETGIDGQDEEEIVHESEDAEPVSNIQESAGIDLPIQHALQAPTLTQSVSSSTSQEATPATDEPGNPNTENTALSTTPATTSPAPATMPAAQHPAGVSTTESDNGAPDNNPTMTHTPPRVSPSRLSPMAPIFVPRPWVAGRWEGSGNPRASNLPPAEYFEHPDYDERLHHEWFEREQTRRQTARLAELAAEEAADRAAREERRRAPPAPVEETAAPAFVLSAPYNHFQGPRTRAGPGELAQAGMINPRWATRYASSTCQWSEDQLKGIVVQLKGERARRWCQSCRNTGLPSEDQPFDCCKSLPYHAVRPRHAWQHLACGNCRFRGRALSCEFGTRRGR